MRRLLRAEGFGGGAFFLWGLIRIGSKRKDKRTIPSKETKGVIDSLGCKKSGTIYPINVSVCQIFVILKISFSNFFGICQSQGRTRKRL